MGKGNGRLFQHNAGIDKHSDQDWNVVELEVLESRRRLHHKVNEIIRLADNTSLSTGEIRQHLLQGVATFGSSFTRQLVRSLHHDNPDQRQIIVWLLTVLNDPHAIIPLQFMSRNQHLPRLVRLSASLALAGMGVTSAIHPQSINSPSRPSFIYLEQANK